MALSGLCLCCIGHEVAPDAGSCVLALPAALWSGHSHLKRLPPSLGSCRTPVSLSCHRAWAFSSGSWGREQLNRDGRCLWGEMGVGEA